MQSFDSTPNRNNVHLNNRERQFLQLACTELTYVQIADRMCVSPRTVDGYREAFFTRFELKSRVGLVLWAIKGGWVAL